MQNINYQKKLEQILNNIDLENKKYSLLLHSCCAPCSSYVLEYLSSFFNITVFFYNPNIHPHSEYIKRLNEQKKFINDFELKIKNKNNFIEIEFNNLEFYNYIKGFENEPEKGNRCYKCYELRIFETAKYALKHKFDYFTTTLSISPHKNSQKINEIGEKNSQNFNVKYLYADFKKNEGFKRSLQISKKYNLYRQNYCGCIFSKNKTKII